MRVWLLLFAHGWQCLTSPSSNSPQRAVVIISMKELIPTAHRYDPEDTVVTYSLIGGMAVIALSLVLFKL